MAKNSKNHQINNNYEYEDNDIYAILQARLTQLAGENLENFVILPPIDNVIFGQLQNSLRDERQRNKGSERHILIPCNIGNSHWVGIYLFIDENDKVVKALYFDSLNPKQPIPESFQRQFRLVYNQCRLKAITLMQQQDITSCGAYTIENLLIAAGLAKLEPISSEQIRFWQLDSLEQYHPNFYQSFYQRQLNNQSTVASLSKQVSFLHGFSKIKFSSAELESISRARIYLDNIENQEIKDLLLEALQNPHGLEHKDHLNYIRKAFQNLFSRTFKYLGEDLRYLSMLSKIFFGKEWLGGKLKDLIDDTTSFIISYEALRAIGKPITGQDLEDSKKVIETTKKINNEKQELSKKFLENVQEQVDKKNAPILELEEEFKKRLTMAPTPKNDALTVKTFLKKIADIKNDITKLENDKYLAKSERLAKARDYYQTLLLYQKHLKENGYLLDASQHGGLTTLEENHLPKILNLKSKLEIIIESANSQQKKLLLQSEKEAKTVSEVIARAIQRYKVKKAYKAINGGRKYKKALGDFSPPITSNPIQALSQANIRTLRHKLRKDLQQLIDSEKLPPNANNSFGLLPDEIALFKALLDLPFKIQHATNHFNEVVAAGHLDSYAEIRRYNPNFRSTFSTPANVQELGNDGFVCFRTYVGGVNGEETRYGNTRIVMDLSILRSIGWVSLHDQLVPFSNTQRRQSFYEGKRLLFQAQPANISNTAKAKKSSDGIEYTYRTSPITNFHKGPLDTQKDFGEKVATTSETISFTEEIFFGKDILSGIALSVIYRLRKLASCGYKNHILNLFISADDQEKIILLGNLVKNFYRIEGKYPVGLKLQYHGDNQRGFFKPIAGSDSQRSKSDCHFTVENPDGDGTFNFDLSVNPDNARYSYYHSKYRQVSEQIGLTQKQIGRFSGQDKKVTQLHEELKKLQIQQTVLQDKIQKLQEETAEMISVIESYCTGKNTSWLKKKSYEFLKLVYEDFFDLLEDEVISADDLSQITLYKLQLISHEALMTLLEDDKVTFDQLAKLDYNELLDISELDLDLVFHQRDISFDQFIAIYRRGGLALECILCEDLTDLAMQHAPEIPQMIIDFADEFGEEIDLEFIQGELGETDQMLFDVAFGFNEDNDQGSLCSYEDDDYREDSTEDESEISRAPSIEGSEENEAVEGESEERQEPSDEDSDNELESRVRRFNT